MAVTNGSTSTDEETSRSSHLPQATGSTGPVLTSEPSALFRDNDRVDNDNQNSRGIIYDAPADLPNDLVSRLDTILVLSGGVPVVLDEPPLYVQRRCDDAVSVLRRWQSICVEDEEEPQIPILCVGAGTAHLPQPFSRRGLPIWEATASAAYLQSQYGIHDNVYLETTSYDTIGNAFFVRTSHTDITGWRKLLVITSKFHVSRAKAIFDWIFGVDNAGYEVNYLASPDVGLEDDALAARQAKEKTSEERIYALARTHYTLRSVWKFFHDTHGFHNAKKLIERDSNNDVQQVPATAPAEATSGNVASAGRMRALLTPTVSSISVDSMGFDGESTESPEQLLMKSYGS